MWPNSIFCHFKNGQKKCNSTRKICLNFFKYSGPLWAGFMFIYLSLCVWITYFNSNQQKNNTLFFILSWKDLYYLLLSDSKPLCNQKNVHFVSILWYWWGSQLDHQSFSMHLTLTFIRWSTALYPIQMGHTTFKQWFPLGMGQIFKEVAGSWCSNLTGRARVPRYFSRVDKKDHMV